MTIKPSSDLEATLQLEGETQIHSSYRRDLVTPPPETGGGETELVRSFCVLTSLEQSKGVILMLD